MKFISTSILIITVIFLLSGCKDSIQYDIASALGKAEKVMNLDDSVKTVASSYDGQDKIKFRILAKNRVDNAEAKRLISNFIVEINKATDARKTNFWDYYSLSFDIMDGKTGTELYKGIKEKSNKEIYWIL